MDETVATIPIALPIQNSGINHHHASLPENNIKEHNKKIDTKENFDTTAVQRIDPQVSLHINVSSKLVLAMQRELNKDLKNKQSSEGEQKKLQTNAFTENEIFDQNDQQKEEQPIIGEFNMSEDELKNVNMTKTNDETHNFQNELFVTFAVNQQSDPDLPYFQGGFLFEDYIQNEKQNQNEIRRTSSYHSTFTKFVEVDVKVVKQKPTLPNFIKKQADEIEQKFEKVQRRLTNLNGKIMETEARMKMDKKSWRYFNLKIVDSQIFIGEASIKISKIQKIKIFPPGQDIPKHNTLKLTMKGTERQEIFLALKKSSKWAELPLPYATFVKVIIKKLKNVGIRNATQWDIPGKKPKKYTILNEKVEPSIKNKKQSEGDDERKIERSKSKQKGSVSNLSETSIIYRYDNVSVYIHGLIFKKSQFLGKWEKRYTVINQACILSYRHENDEEPSIKIQKNSIKYMWTWFSILEQQKNMSNKGSFGSQERQRKVRQYTEKEVVSLLLQEKSERESNFYLIIKIKYGFNEQTEFAIPICNFDVAIGKNKNWLLAFYKILPQLQKQQ